MTYKYPFIFLFMLLFYSSIAQNTVGVITYTDQVTDGYTINSPNGTNTTFLIDNCGRIVNEWQGNHKPAFSVYLTPEGDLLQTCWTENQYFNAGGNAGRIEKYDWNGNLIWEFDYSSETVCSHHDIELLPNGNVLIIAWEKISDDDAFALGRREGELTDTEFFPEHIVEVEPSGSSGGNIVWEWHVLDHLIQDEDPAKPNYGIVADHPERVDINFYRNTRADWLHMNAIDYNPQLDQIILSVKNFSEVWIIDHSTTTIEAAGSSGGNSGMGGDILYRWGNPQAYGRGTSADQVFDNQHDAQWVPEGYPNAGDILVFNNGAERGYSSVDRITPPVDGYNYTISPMSSFLPSLLDWSYDGGQSFFSPKISGVQPLVNGHHLICVGRNGLFMEIDDRDEVVWEYVNPINSNGPFEQGETTHNGNSVFRAHRYMVDFAGFIGKDLTPGAYIELNANPICTEETLSNKDVNVIVSVYPNPASDFLIVEVKGQIFELVVTNLSGKVVRSSSSGNHLNLEGFQAGQYFVTVNTNDGSFTQRFVVE